MPSLKDLFTNLKAGIVGTRTQKIDKQIDTSMRVLQTYGSQSSRNIYHDVMRNMVTAVGKPESDDFLKEINKVGGAEALGQGERINRYNEYEQIVRNIAYCQRALKVLTDNILAPDDITKRAIQVVAEDHEKVSDIKTETSISRIKQIVKAINLEKHTDRLVSTTLKKGDYFLEIIYSPKGQNAMQILTENASNVLNEYYGEGEPIEFNITVEGENKKTEQRSGKIILTEFNPFGGALFQKSPVTAGPAAWNTASGMPVTHKPYNAQPKSKDPNITKHVDNDPYEKNLKRQGYKFKNKFENENGECEDKNKPKDLKDLFVTFHDPRYVVKLQTERFRVCLGYLIFPKIEKGMQQAQLWNVNTGDVDQICIKIMDQLQTKIDTGKDCLPKHSDLRDIVSKYIKDVKEGEDLKIRYVSPEMISHWKIGSDLYDPYGESIFDSVMFDSKLLMAMKTAQTIKQLTSATDKRVIKVETGLPRDSKNLIELMKESLRKRKISIDQFGSVDSIPSHISTFEDIYIPMRDGKEFVSIDNMQFGPDPQNDVEPMRFIRDNIVANLGVPPAFLGLEENTCLSFFTKIPLLNGQTIEIGKLVEAFEKEPDKFNVWVYSIDPKNHRIVPGKITKAMWTRKNAQMVRVYLDNEKFEECTPDHKWMLRDGTYKEAKDLKPGDSLMPFYRKNSSHKLRNNTTYTQVMHPATNRYQTCHRIVCEGLGTVKKNDGMQVHHIDGNPKNNHPDNLLVCSPSKHLSLHSDFRYKSNDLATYSITEVRNCCVCNKEFKCRVQSSQSTCLSDQCVTERKRLAGIKSWEKRKIRAGKEVSVTTCEWDNKKYMLMKSCKNRECSNACRGYNTAYTRFGSIPQIKEVLVNHKVSKIEYLKERQNCCDIEVDKYHNFAVDSGVFVHNSNRALLTVENILFARNVIAYQRVFSDMLHDLLEKMYLLIYPEGIGDLDTIIVTFPPPKASPYEHQMEYIEQMVRLAEALETFGVPKSYSKRKYLPDIDWDEVERADAAHKAKTELGEEPDPNEGMMGGGMGGF